ncbi:MAG: methyl-accepting chemotaxis protein [Gammaproteobacteria bacterium]|nr:methyl-accepting chemotaxis protein [Gammaproteobacteria bacterium]
MKINQPVTNHEINFPESYNILSTTDLKGSITYCNQDFVEISGFSLDELEGRNHNIVRHPDMPPAAFEDLWSSVKNDHPWMGMVKNRCKDGSFYWVDAYVTPIKENGTVNEYQSVRTKPDREVIKRAESTYQLLMQGKLPFRLRLPNINTGVKLSLGFSVAVVPPLALLIATNGVSLSTLLICGLSLIGAMSTIFSVSKRIAQVAQVSRKVIRNPLMQWIYTHSTDDVGEIELAIKMQSSELRAVVGRVSDSSLSLKESVDDLSSTIEKTNIRIHDQQVQTDLVATAMNEMSSTVQEVARNAAYASESTLEAQQAAQAGQQVVNNTISSISEVASSVDQASEVINKLNDNAGNITSIVEVIRGIADQTNLLALNAAIEAARAGEQGRGFAVVADEVRSLAQRTQTSTQEIQEMVENLQAGSDQAVKMMQEGREKSEVCVQHATDAGEMLNNITQAVSIVSDVNIQIATAAEEQSAVADEINMNVVNINEAAQGTASDAARTSEISQKLSEEAQRQQQLVTQFQR